MFNKLFYCMIMLSFIGMAKADDPPTTEDLYNKACDARTAIDIAIDYYGSMLYTDGPAFKVAQNNASQKQWTNEQQTLLDTYTTNFNYGYNLANQNLCDATMHSDIANSLLIEASNAITGGDDKTAKLKILAAVDEMALANGYIPYVVIGLSSEEYYLGLYNDMVNSQP